MMAGNPNWWSLSSTPSFFHHQEIPQSWCQLLKGVVQGDDQESFGGQNNVHPKKWENWGEEEEQILSSSQSIHVLDVKQEVSQNSYIYGHRDEEYQAPIRPSWSQIMPISSPKSCVTSLSSNILDFSSNNEDHRHQQLHHSSDQCHSTATGGVCKKARVQPSSSQPSLKVRKEKLGDRITALHQLVSPFGKTDTASVLLEAIGYIRFLQGQIEALSSPYLRTAPGTTRKHQPYQDTHQDKAMDLRSRGLCLVSVSCTQQVGSDTGADYWAPTYGGGF